VSASQVASTGGKAWKKRIGQRDFYLILPDREEGGTEGKLVKEKRLC